jgi:PAS domain S-box-containing protein
VWTILPDGSVNYCNRRWTEYSGLALEEAHAHGWMANLHPADEEPVMRAWQEAKARVAPYEMEKRLRGVDGQYRRFLSRAVPVCDEQGRLLQWFGTYTDVEDRKRAEEALRDAQIELAHVTRLTTVGELAASLAHELNQPLAAVVTNGSACLRWLGRAQPDLDEATQAVQRIIRDANRAADVIAHTRALLKKSTSEKAALDVAEAIREILILVHSEVLRHRIVVHTAFEPELPPVWGDRVQLQQVLLNLIVNGIDAMTDVADGGRDLAILAWRQERDGAAEVAVTVQDAGVGVTPEQLERLFDAFYTTKAQGLGMGLSISRSIVQGHGGRLWATANAGPGARFQFVLPAWSKPES